MLNLHKFCKVLVIKAELKKGYVILNIFISLLMVASCKKKGNNIEFSAPKFSIDEI